MKLKFDVISPSLCAVIMVLHIFLPFVASDPKLINKNQSVEKSIYKARKYFAKWCLTQNIPFLWIGILSAKA